MTPDDARRELEARRPHLRLVRESEPIGAPEDHVLALSVHQQRRFLGMPDDEPTELTYFCGGRIHVAHVLGANGHLRLLRDGEGLREFTAAYQLVNGPIDRRLLARYEPDRIHRASNGRVTDRDVEARRAVFLDIDPVRPKGISATEDEKRAAYDVSAEVEAFLAARIGQCAIGRGDSGNGYFLLVAIEPCAPEPETTIRISRLLEVLDRRFGTEQVKIDRAVANAARLMPAAGTWKRKGADTSGRPHRRTSFSCRGDVLRVPLEALC